MQHWKAELSRLGYVETFDYPYMLRKGTRPDPMRILVESHRQALCRLRNNHDGELFLVGKSLGSRVGCHLALEEQVTGIVCLGYPLQGVNGRMRDKVLLALATPILFIQGTRDKLCPLDLLANVRGAMKAPNFVHVVEGGDHSLLVTKRQSKLQGETQEEVDRQIREGIQSFVSELTAI